MASIIELPAFENEVESWLEEDGCRAAGSGGSTGPPAVEPEPEPEEEAAEPAAAADMANEADSGER